MSMTKSKVRWGELEDDDDEEEDLSQLLPPTRVIGPDAKGIKITISYKFDDERRLVKKTTTSRIRKVVQTWPVKKSVGERRSWAKFGDAVDSAPSLTVVSNEEVRFDRSRQHAGNKEEKKMIDSNNAKTSSGSTRICRTCGKEGDHWTVKCPYKDLNNIGDNKPSLMNPSSTLSSTTTTTTTTTSNGKYVPPSARLMNKGNGDDRNGSSDMRLRRRNNDDNSIRITNISEDTKEDDLQELCERFGHVTRVYVGRDRNTGLSRGFGFVSFATREAANKAVDKLDGYGYDSLILRVQFSSPS